jgi:hypothetical protein
VTLRGRSGADAQLDARLTAGGLAVGAKGTARLFSASGLAAALDLTLQAADVGPLRRGAAARASVLLPVALRARLNATASDLALEGITGSIGGAPVRGKLKLTSFRAHRRADRHRLGGRDGAARDCVGHAEAARRRARVEQRAVRR